MVNEGEEISKSEGGESRPEKSTAQAALPEIGKAGLASLGCGLIGLGLVAIFAGALFFIGVPGLAMELPALLAVAVVALGFYLLRKFTVDTTVWFVIALFCFIFGSGGFFDQSQAGVSLIFFAFGWWMLFVNNRVATERRAAAAAAPIVEVASVEVGQTDAGPTSAAPQSGTTSQAVGASFGCLAAVAGGVLLMIGLLNGMVSGIGAAADALSGSKGPIGQDWGGANTQINAGMLLLIGGLIVFFYALKKKR